MQISLFLAKAWGVYLLIFGAGIFLGGKQNLNTFLGEMSKRATMRFYGLVSLILGIVSVLAHNIWVSDYRGLVTFFGWMALVKGVTGLFWPELGVKFVKRSKFEKWYRLWAVIVLALGGYLAYIGFGLG